jgi:lipoate-protein ligase A
MSVILGRSNKAAREALKSMCEEDSIPIMKRLGGGGTVLLHPGCLVVSVGTWVRDFYQNDLYFRMLNQAVIDTIQLQVPEISLGQRGHSDIVFQEKKLAGTSLFRSRNYLLYQASLLVDPKIPLIEKYLAHPSAEPDYRKGRRHSDFLIGLGEFIDLSPAQWASHFQEKLEEVMKRLLETEMIGAQSQQIAHIKSRIGETHPID